MTDNTQIAFGDNVRIRSTPDTEAAGVAGLAGQVYGVTTPSVTGVGVIGRISDDIAFNVYFDDRGEALWFARDLIEFIDHAPGTVVSWDGVPTKVRTESGEWEEIPRDRRRASLLRRIIDLFGKRG